MAAPSSSDEKSNWLQRGKDGIKERERKDALKRIETLKKLVPKSVKDTFKELKLSKYETTLSTQFGLSESEIVTALTNAWDTLKLNEEFKGPNNADTLDNWDKYFEQCEVYADTNKYEVEHVFWELVLNDICNYAKEIADAIFSDHLDTQLGQTLAQSLCVCTLLDILQCAVQSASNKKTLLLPKTLVCSSVNLQNAINKAIGTRLDIEKWKANATDNKKVYKQYCIAIQKEAMKAGKDFVKLYKLHKIRKHKERKQSQTEQKKEPKTEEVTKEEKTAEKTAEKKQESEFESADSYTLTRKLTDFAFVIMLIVVAVCVKILLERN